MPRSSVDKIDCDKLAKDLIDLMTKSKSHPNSCICRDCELRKEFEKLEIKHFRVKEVSKMVH